MKFNNLAVVVGVFLSCTVSWAGMEFDGDELDKILTLYRRVAIPALDLVPNDNSKVCGSRLMAATNKVSDIDALFWEVEHYFKAGIDPRDLVRIKYGAGGRIKPEYSFWWINFHSKFPDSADFFNRVGSAPRRNFVSSDSEVTYRFENSESSVRRPMISPWQSYPTGLDEFSKTNAGVSSREMIIELWARWVITGTSFDIHYDFTLSELTKRYRELMFRFHPDRNPGNQSAEEASRAITVAFGILRQSCRAE